jgi:hypothetical protein
MNAWIVGLHLLSLHSPSCWENDWGRCVEYNKPTSGIYARAPNGFSFGAITNSYRRASGYAGWTWQTDDERFALTVAGLSGYPRRGVQLMVMPSVKMDLPGRWALRLGASPRAEKGGAALVHLSVERRL